eukprot:COSAG05_NODE_67_length_22197_cov_42.906417_11_plen_301_part_00
MATAAAPRPLAPHPAVLCRALQAAAVGLVGHVLQAAAVGLVDHALFLLAVAVAPAGPVHGHPVEVAALAGRGLPVEVAALAGHGRLAAVVALVVPYLGPWVAAAGRAALSSHPVVRQVAAAAPLVDLCLVVGHLAAVVEQVALSSHLNSTQLSVTKLWSRSAAQTGTWWSSRRRRRCSWWTASTPTRRRRWCRRPSPSCTSGWWRWRWGAAPSSCPRRSTRRWGRWPTTRPRRPRWWVRLRLWLGRGRRFWLLHPLVFGHAEPLKDGGASFELFLDVASGRKYAALQRLEQRSQGTQVAY